jgi:hypothetical protein
VQFRRDHAAARRASAPGEGAHAIRLSDTLRRDFRPKADVVAA